MPDQDQTIREAIDRGGGQTGDIDGVLRELSAAGFTIVSRGAIGGNFPPLAQSIAAESGDFADVVTAFLEEAYRQYPTQMDQLLDGAANLPNPITTQEDKIATAAVVKDIRDLAAKFDAFHKKEKQPYFRGGQAVDQFFFSMIDQLLRRSRTARAGVGDLLLQRITEYDDRVIAEETARRKAIADEAARVARIAQETAAREAQEAAERQLAEQRARKPDTIQARGAEARGAEARASASGVEAAVAGQRAERAHQDTLITAPEIVRTRSAEGTLSTTVTEKFATLVDKRLVDKEVLWPFIPASEIEKALRAWAKTTDYNTPMAGAEIGKRNKARVR